MTKQEFIVAVGGCTSSRNLGNPFVVVEAFDNLYVLNKHEVSSLKRYDEFNKAAYLYIDMEKEYNLIINERCYLMYKVVRTPLMKAAFEFAATPIEKRFVS